MTVEIPSQYTHSLKLEETSKGVRISVHVYANDQEQVIPAAIIYLVYPMLYAAVKCFNLFRCLLNR